MSTVTRTLFSGLAAALVLSLGTLADPQDAGEDAYDVAVDQRLPAIEGDRGDRARGVSADSLETAQPFGGVGEPATVLRDDRLGGRLRRLVRRRSARDGDPLPSPFSAARGRCAAR